MDYRNAIKWYQYDPTKWLIWLCSKVGLASHLKVGLLLPLTKHDLICVQTFPQNEINKGRLTMELKRLRKKQEKLVWPPDLLPVVDWKSCKCSHSHPLSYVLNFLCVDQSQAALRPLLCIGGFIHDVECFMDEHPGGEALLRSHIGKDATAAFFGGVYSHSNAAHNVRFSFPLLHMLMCTPFPSYLR